MTTKSPMVLSVMHAKQATSPNTGTDLVLPERGGAPFSWTPALIDLEAKAQFQATVTKQRNQLISERPTPALLQMIKQIEDRATDLQASNGVNHRKPPISAVLHKRIGPKNVGADLAVVFGGADPNSESLSITLPPDCTCEQKGRFWNIKLGSRTLATAVNIINAGGDKFPETNLLDGKTVTIDYSSPNLAKPLHIGHLRSTVIGHALRNLYETVGANVIGINHLGDWGGFGHLIEGWNRWREKLNPLSDNEALSKIYLIKRTAEKIFDAEDEAERDVAFRDEGTRNVLKPFFELESLDVFMQEYQEFHSASNEQFLALERGDDPSAIETWKTLCGVTSEDLDPFYNALGIRVDNVIGESNYIDSARELARELVGKDLPNMKVVRGEDGAIYAEFLDGRPDKHMVLIRSDQGTLYGSRDAAALVHRSMNLKSDLVIYPIGLEQSDQLKAAFEIARASGYVRDTTATHHLKFGHYKNQGAKIASRKGAEKVTDLLEELNDYFGKKISEGQERLKDNEGFTPMRPDEIEQSARLIARACISCLEAEHANPNHVNLPAERDKLYELFEKSGGAYFIYTACRALSVCLKAEARHPNLASEDCPVVEFTDEEADLINTCTALPHILNRAAKDCELVAIPQYILKLSSLYNHYYKENRVIDGETVHTHRYAISKMVSNTIRGALKAIGVETPERI